MAKTNTITEEIEIPPGIKASLEGSLMKIAGQKGELLYNFEYPGVHISLKDNKAVVYAENASRIEKAIIGTYRTHIKNMIKGVTDGHKCRLKIVYSHFPITLKTAGNIIEVSNFFGEKAPRKARVVGNVKLSITKEEVVVEGINKEDVGQTAANLEQATRVKRKDTRVFQDGIYIVEKP